MIKLKPAFLLFFHNETFSSKGVHCC
jgi:hypothetical protein